jgi:hypothetical protein
MRNLFFLPFLLICLAAQAVTYPNRFVTNVDGTLIDGSTLINVPGYSPMTVHWAGTGDLTLNTNKGVGIYSLGTAAAPGALVLMGAGFYINGANNGPPFGFIDANGNMAYGGPPYNNNYAYFPYLRGTLEVMTNLPPGGVALAPLLPVPPLGYNSDFDTITPTAVQMKAAADLFVSQGMQAGGWNNIALDDGWQGGTRDGGGALQPDATAFPLGMPNLVNYIHTDGTGFKFWIYTSYSYLSCAGKLGTDTAHIATDVQKFGSWLCDGLKIDGCGGGFGADGLVYDPGSDDWLHRAARKFSEVNLNLPYNPNFAVPSMALLASTWQQPVASGYGPVPWYSLEGLNIVEDGVGHGPGVTGAVYNATLKLPNYWHVRPGQYVEQGGLGNNDANTNYIQTQLALDAILCSPIFIGTISSAHTYIYTNTIFRSVHQDAQVLCGTMVFTNASTEIWARSVNHRGGPSNLVNLAGHPISTVGPLTNLACMVNLSNINQTITLNVSQLGLASNLVVTVYDMWMGTNGTFINTMPVVIAPTNSQAFLCVQAQDGSALANVALLNSANIFSNQVSIKSASGGLALFNRDNFGLDPLLYGNASQFHIYAGGALGADMVTWDMNNANMVNVGTVQAPGFVSTKNHGAALTSITVTASPFTYTASGGANEMVFIAGGTITLVKVNGTTVFTVASDITIPLQTGEAVQVTYSVAPTMWSKAF